MNLLSFEKFLTQLKENTTTTLEGVCWVRFERDGDLYVRLVKEQDEINMEPMRSNTVDLVRLNMVEAAHTVVVTTGELDFGEVLALAAAITSTAFSAPTFGFGEADRYVVYTCRNGEAKVEEIGIRHMSTAPLMFDANDRPFVAGEKKNADGSRESVKLLPTPMAPTR